MHPGHLTDVMMLISQARLYPRAHRLVVAALCLTCATVQAQRYASLVENSPFIHPDAPASQQPAQAAPTTPVAQQLDFRGVYQIGDDYRFLVSEKRRRHTGSWLRMKDASGDIVVKDYRADNHSVLVSYNGMEGWLELVKVDASPGPATTVAAAAGTPATVRPVTTPAARPAAAAVGRGGSATTAGSRPSRVVTPPRVSRPGATGAGGSGGSTGIGAGDLSDVNVNRLPPPPPPSSQPPIPRPPGRPAPPDPSMLPVEGMPLP
jgi:hypothetical protein